MENKKAKTSGPTSPAKKTLTKGTTKSKTTTTGEAGPGKGSEKGPPKKWAGTLYNKEKSNKKK